MKQLTAKQLLPLVIAGAAAAVFAWFGARWYIGGGEVTLPSGVVVSHPSFGLTLAPNQRQELVHIQDLFDRYVELVAADKRDEAAKLWLKPPADPSMFVPTQAQGAKRVDILSFYLSADTEGRRTGGLRFSAGGYAHSFHVVRQGTEWRIQSVSSRQSTSVQGNITE